jgi:hypothetical protein
VPYKYIVECVCDKLAATKTYAKENYTSELPLLHWNRYGHLAEANPRSKEFIERVFLDIKEHGDDYVLNKKYMKRVFSEICEDKEL